MRINEMMKAIGGQVPYELIVLLARYEMLDPQARDELLRYRLSYDMEHVEAVIGHIASKAQGHVSCEIDRIDYDLMRVLTARFAPTLVTIDHMHALVGCSPDPCGAGLALYYWSEAQPSVGCPLYITHPKLLLDMPPLSRAFAGIWLTAIDKHVIKG